MKEMIEQFLFQTGQDNGQGGRGYNSMNQHELKEKNKELSSVQFLFQQVATLFSV
jgi:hypothetical protein